MLIFDDHIETSLVRYAADHCSSVTYSLGLFATMYCWSTFDAFDRLIALHDKQISFKSSVHVIFFVKLAIWMNIIICRK